MKPPTCFASGGVTGRNESRPFLSYRQVSLNPVRVLSHEADEEKAEVARLSSFVGAMAIGDLVKSTLGPKGMDKILWGVGRNEGQVQPLITSLPLSPW